MKKNEQPTIRALAAGLLGAALALGTGACTPAADEDSTVLTPEQSDEALKMRHEYEAAVMARDYAGAAHIADRLRKKYPDSDAMAGVRKTLDDTIARAEAAVGADRLAALWEYQKVAAAGGTQYTALLPSHVETDENGVPSGPPDARLVLRVHPEWGKSAYLLLSQSQFTCPDPCTIQISFDGATADDYAGEQADSGNGPALFIKERERFYSAMRNAQEMKITLPKAGTFNSALHFDVGGYNAERLGTEF